ncbi:MAG: hypothetical protein V9F00_04880 [Nocardioides sp.]
MLNPFSMRNESKEHEQIQDAERWVKSHPSLKRRRNYFALPSGGGTSDFTPGLAPNAVVMILVALLVRMKGRRRGPVVRAEEVDDAFDVRPNESYRVGL